MVNLGSLKSIYQGKNVFVTGHTGFKGSWLVCYLKLLGANVKGYALAPNTEPSHFRLFPPNCNTTIHDIRDFDFLVKELKNFNPEIIFHLAAQPLVRYSYANPLETYEVNVMGTANLLNAARKLDNCKAIINITTDKCYENIEQDYAYKESDPMGGFDPYSSSKGCSELVSSSFRNSFFNLEDFGTKHQTLVATARAGNVIGGGDWSEDRLIPDIVRAANNSKEVSIRSPEATRPWQHVLESLTGYIILGEKLLSGNKEFACAFNFGPVYEGMLSVEEVITQAKTYWDKIEYKIEPDNSLHEANLLKLDSSKAMKMLNWRSVWSFEKSIENTIEWYRSYYQSKEILTLSQLEDYIKECFCE